MPPYIKSVHYVKQVNLKSTLVKGISILSFEVEYFSCNEWKWRTKYRSKKKNPHEICRHLHNGPKETKWEDFVRGTTWTLALYISIMLWMVFLSLKKSICLCMNYLLKQIRKIHVSIRWQNSNRERIRIVRFKQTLLLSICIVRCVIL